MGGSGPVFAMFFSVLFALLFSYTSAAPVSLGISFNSSRTDALPLLILPYATYQAFSYDLSGDYYTFKNIRFAAPPLGDLRWTKPQPPLTETGVQDGTVGFQCQQATPADLSFAYPILESLEPASEDCLFLDVEVPGSAVRGEVKDLPILFWIFGGGYVFGSKSFALYDGAPYLDVSNNSLIYVATNYRLGAYGFLNGPTVEDEGTPNAGFWDQRAALDWVQSYISLLGGDASSVTVMGESAGGGSIMHHLTAVGGTLQPQFKQAIMQSPAFLPQYNETLIEAQYADFEAKAGCSGQGLACLRTKSTDVLQAANLGVVLEAPYGQFGFGPAVDNQYVLDLPAFELAAGNYWKGIPVLLGHTSNEGIIFADPSIVLDSQFNNELASVFTGANASTLTEIETLYPAPSLLGPYLSNFERLYTLIGQWLIGCNTRYLAQAYAGEAWTYEFSIIPGVHAEDLLLTFWRTGIDIGQYLQIDLPSIDLLTTHNLATGFQSYLASFVITGNPNTLRQSADLPPTIQFNQATVGSSVQVMNIELTGFNMAQDTLAPEGTCGFWQSGVWAGK